MREIGRLREIAFRFYGGGTGEPVDIDEFDTMPGAYRQLVVWSPEDEQILGGYRFICGSDTRRDEQGKPILATSHLFNFSPKFVDEILPYTVELGRSFVALEYQSTRAASKDPGRLERSLCPRQPVGRIGSLDGDRSQTALFLR